MNVGTYLEIYTLHYGLSLYNAFWTLLASTGLAMWPILKMLYDNWRSPAESSSSEAPGALESIQKMKWALIFKVFMLFTAVVPLSSLATDQTAYVSSCGNTVHGTYQFGNTGTTWDALANTVSGGNTASQIPILFNLALKISYGMNAYIVQSMPCLGDIRALDQQMHNINLNNPQIESEYNQFFSQCYGPAKTKLLEALRSSSGDPSVDAYYQQQYSAYIAAGGSNENLNKLYSEFFVNTPGLYAHCNNTAECNNTWQATQPVTGWPHLPSRDAGMSPTQAAASQGQPYCSEWWTSLKPRLADATKFHYTHYDAVTGQEYSYIKNFVNTVGTALHDVFRTDDDFQNWVIDHLQTSAPPKLVGLYGETANNEGLAMQTMSGDSSGGIDDWSAALLGTVGFGVLKRLPGVGDLSTQVVSEFAGFYATMYIVKKAAPIMKALIMMLIFALLPLYLVISEYEVGSVITGLILVMVVNLFTAMFEIANYLETVMFQALYPGWATVNATVAYGVEIMLIDVLLLLLYVVAPMLMLMMVQMAGQRIKDAGGQGLAESKSISSTGGNIAGNATRSTANKMGRGGGKRK